ncbi:MAG: hypothetical protein IJK18_08520 [Clostridia bacterium]|nr:hypothetical protein [Clostridia bacterium]
MKEGTKIIVYYVEAAYNTSKRMRKSRECTFIKEYSNYIQFYDKYHIRRSVMKQDLIDIERVED